MLLYKGLAMLLDQEFTASDVAQIADVKPENLQLWLKRRLVVGHRPGRDAGITGGGSQGRHRRFKWFSAMEFALAGELIRHGFPPKRAFEIARRFSHVGDGSGHLAGESPGPMRRPGVPFHHSFGETLLIISGDFTYIACENVPGQSEQNAPDKLRRAVVRTVVNVSALFDEMCARLNVHPYIALDNIYPAAGDRAEPVGR